MCDSFSDERVTGDGLLAIVEIFNEGVYGVRVVVGAVVVVVVVAAVGVSAAMSLIDENRMYIVGDRWNEYGRQYAECDDWYCMVGILP